MGTSARALSASATNNHSHETCVAVDLGAATEGVSVQQPAIMLLTVLLGAVAYEDDWDRGSLVQKLDASQMQTAIMKHDKVCT